MRNYPRSAGSQRLLARRVIAVPQHHGPRQRRGRGRGRRGLNWSSSKRCGLRGGASELTAVPIRRCQHKHLQHRCRWRRDSGKPRGGRDRTRGHGSHRWLRSRQCPRDNWRARGHHCGKRPAQGRSGRPRHKPRNGAGRIAGQRRRRRIWSVPPRIVIQARKLALAPVLEWKAAGQVRPPCPGHSWSVRLRPSWRSRAIRRYLRSKVPWRVH